ncbi:EF-hand domain-containing protein, partial [Derxia lacustris]|uniref:EF-hand domain-containing protein n=1 Tax=Derxia lacustris TaxID=764842 RepID=UPI00111BFE17
MNRFRPALLALLLLAAAPAFAQTAGGDRAAKAQQMVAELEQRFARADTDHDGQLTRAEAAAMPRVRDNFDAIDSGKTGAVTLAVV